jgi:hypothetical protein
MVMVKVFLREGDDVLSLALGLPALHLVGFLPVNARVITHVLPVIFLSAKHILYEFIAEVFRHAHHASRLSCGQLLWTQTGRLAPLKSLLLRETRIFKVSQDPGSSMIAAGVGHSIQGTAELLPGISMDVLEGVSIMWSGWWSHRMMLRKVADTLSLLLLC